MWTTPRVYTGSTCSAHGSSPGSGDGPQTLSCPTSGYSWNTKGLDLDLGSAVIASGADFVVEWDMLVTGYGTREDHIATLMASGNEHQRLLRALDWGATSCNDQQTHSYRLEATSSGKTVCGTFKTPSLRFEFIINSWKWKSNLFKKTLFIWTLYLFGHFKQICCQLFIYLISIKLNQLGCAGVLRREPHPLRHLLRCVHIHHALHALHYAGVSLCSIGNTLLPCVRDV